MRTLLRACAAGVMIAGAHAAGDWIEQGDSLDRGFKSAEALAAYQKALAADPDKADLLRKISKQYVEMVLDAPSKKEKLRLAQLGYDTALQAKKLAPNDPEVRVTVAVAAGRLAFYSESRRRLELSSVVRSESAEAVRLDPRFALGWHVLGRWNYEIANLNPLLRVVAEAVYGKMPPASNDEAIRALSRAVQLEPGNALFHAELGRAYLAAGRKDEAKRELQKSLTLPRRSRDDAGAQDRAKQALRGL
ncbi:MAG: tetratricopeptide repeat protein [Chthoniobacterales bacterium]